VTGEADRAESEDHDLVAHLVLAQGLEIELDLHPDAKVVALAHQDPLDPRALGQVDLCHPYEDTSRSLLAKSGTWTYVQV
jgi:hypothetical protein